MDVRFCYYLLVMYQKLELARKAIMNLVNAFKWKEGSKYERRRKMTTDRKAGEVAMLALFLELSPKAALNTCLIPSFAL